MEGYGRAEAVPLQENSKALDWEEELDRRLIGKRKGHKKSKQP
jgi:hypothetical protein